MDTFIARQPIFDRNRRVFGYELLCRSGPENVFGGMEPDAATTKVIGDSSFVFGLDGLTRGRMAFINFTRETLLDEMVELLPPSRTVIEVLETVDPDPEVVNACRRLKERGFLLALDDVEDADQFGALGPLADIVKIDFRATNADRRAAILRRLGGNGTRFLAEKVETHDEVEEARALGCGLYQGFFYCRPHMVRSREMPAFKPRYLRLLRALRAEPVRYAKIETIVRGEVSLTYKLLRYLNSAWIGLKNEVVTIRQAMTLLGERHLRRWATVVTLSCIGEDKPDELVSQAVTRALFEEQIAPLAGLSDRAEEMFLMGLFSLIDAFMDRPLAEILGELTLADDIVAGLLGEDNRVARVHRSALAFEAGDWAGLERLTEDLGVDETAFPPRYLAAIEMARRLVAGP